MLKVGSAAKGSITAVSGWGTSNMSLSLIACQPRMLEPSNPRPSSNVSSSSLPTGIVKCCQSPGKSMNRKSTAFTPRSRHSARTSCGVIGLSFPDMRTRIMWRLPLHPIAHRPGGTIGQDAKNPSLPGPAKRGDHFYPAINAGCVLRNGACRESGQPPCKDPRWTPGGDPPDSLSSHCSPCQPGSESKLPGR